MWDVKWDRMGYGLRDGVWDEMEYGMGYRGGGIWDVKVGRGMRR